MCKIDELYRWKEQLLNTIGGFCSRYENPGFIGKCRRFTCRLVLRGSPILYKLSVPELSAAIVYTAGSNEFTISVQAESLSGDAWLNEISLFFNVPDYIIYGISRTIKELLGISKIHPSGIPDYNSSAPYITLIGIGIDGIEILNKIASCDIKSINCIGTGSSEESLYGFKGSSKILLCSDLKGSISLGCKTTLKDKTSAADVIIIIVNLSKISGLEGQVLGIITESQALRICIPIGENDSNDLLVELLRNGMDTMLHINPGEDISCLLYKMAGEFNKLSVGDGIPARLDFSDVLMLLKNAGNAYAGYGSGSGTDRSIKAIKRIVYGLNIKSVKKMFINISGPVDLGVGEIKGPSDYVRRLSGGGIEIVSNYSINDNLKGEVEIICIFIY